MAQRVCPMAVVPEGGLHPRRRLQFLDPSRALPYFQCAIGADDGNSSAVIAPVAKALQAGKDYGPRLTEADVSHDAAHGASGVRS